MIVSNERDLLHKTGVMLDCLFDTRIATVATMSEDLASRLACHPEYHSRQHNFFNLLVPEIDQKEYEKRYEDRTKEILKLSVVTEFIDVIADMNGRYKVIGEIPIDSITTELVVNAHPYKLSDTEKHLLGMLLQTKTLSDRVTFVYHDPGLISPAVLSTYDMFIFADFDEWLHRQKKFILKGERVNKCFIYAPYCALVDINKFQETTKGFTKEAMEQYLLPLCNIEFAPLSYYSFHRKLSRI